MLTYATLCGYSRCEFPETLRGDACDCKLTQPPWYQLTLWVLKVRDSEMLHLVDGIGQICSSQDKVEEEREVKEETEGVYQESSTYSMRGRHESITRNSESQPTSVSAESEGEKPQGLRGKEGEPGEVDISRGNAEREIAKERERWRLWGVILRL